MAVAPTEPIITAGLPLYPTAMFVLLDQAGYLLARISLHFHQEAGNQTFILSDTAVITEFHQCFLSELVPLCFVSQYAKGNALVAL